MDEGVLTLPAPLFGVLPEHPSFLESISFQLNGLVVVFLALGSIWAVMEIIGSYFKRAEARRSALAPKAAPAPAAVASEPAPLDGKLQPEIVAAIAASVAFVLRGHRYRIEAIAPADVVDWAREGRRQIFASHRVR